MEFLSRIISVFSPPSGSTQDLLVEKRVSPRICCTFAAKAVQKDGKNAVVECTISEVSSSGMRLLAPLKPKNGEILFVAVKPDQGFDCSRYKVDKVRGEVMWSRKRPKSPDYFIGLKFAHTEAELKNSWVSFLLKKLGFEAQKSLQKRKDVRASSRIMVVYAVGSGPEERGVAYNIGMGGMLLGGSQCLQPHTNLFITLGPYESLKKLSMRGKVVRKGYDPMTNTWLSGVAFTNLTADSVKLLGDYVITVLRESAGA